MKIKTLAAIGACVAGVALTSQLSGKTYTTTIEDSEVTYVEGKWPASWNPLEGGWIFGNKNVLTLNLDSGVSQLIDYSGETNLNWEEQGTNEYSNDRLEVITYKTSHGKSTFKSPRSNGRFSDNHDLFETTNRFYNHLKKSISLELKIKSMEEKLGSFE